MIKSRFRSARELPVIALALAIVILLPPIWSYWQEKDLKPGGEFGGQYCSETRPRVVIIRSKEGLPRLPGARFDPAPDFQKTAIVGVFMGQRPTGGFGVEFKEPYVQDGKVMVPVQEHAPEPGRFVTQALTTPCRFKVVPAKPGQEVVVINLNKVADLTYRRIKLETGRFQCDLPQSWYWEKMGVGTSTNPYYVRVPSDFPGEMAGIMLMAPAEMEGEGVRVFVARYVPKDQTSMAEPQTYLEKYPPDDLFFHYIQEKFQSGGQPPAGSPAGRWFTRQSVISLRGTGNKLPIKELLGIIPTKDGFYTLYYWAPAALAEKYEPVFQRVGQSFQPIP